MSKRRNEESAVAAQGNVSDSSGAVVAGMAQRKRRTFDQVWREAYDEGVRHCAEALLDDNKDREYIAWVFCMHDISFPTTDDPGWAGRWTFEDWDDWVAAEESETNGTPTKTEVHPPAFHACGETR